MARDEAYREAEQRIEAARQAGATKLDLSSMQLTELPEAIAALTQLQSLNLYDNQLTELPEVIAALTQLQSLGLSDDQPVVEPSPLCRRNRLSQSPASGVCATDGTLRSVLQGGA